MAIGSPQIVLKLADTDTTNLSSTGASVVNSGTLGTNYVLKGTSATRAASNGLWTGSGRLSGSSNTNGAQVWMTNSASTALGTALRCISAAAAFKLTSLNDGAAKIATPNGSNRDGNITINCYTPVGGGNFDMDVECRHLGGAGTVITYTALTFGTVYQVAMSVDMNTTGAVVPRAKLNSASVVTGSSVSFASFSMEDAWPRLLHRQDFPGNGGFGFNGDLYYFAELIDATAFWSSADLDSINADPTVLFGAAPPATGPPVLYRRGPTFVNDELILI